MLTVDERRDILDAIDTRLFAAKDLPESAEFLREEARILSEELQRREMEDVPTKTRR